MIFSDETVQEADQIRIIMDQGRVVMRQRRHAELMQQGGYLSGYLLRIPGKLQWRIAEWKK